MLIGHCQQDVARLEVGAGREVKRQTVNLVGQAGHGVGNMHNQAQAKVHQVQGGVASQVHHAQAHAHAQQGQVQAERLHVDAMTAKTTELTT